MIHLQQINSSQVPKHHPTTCVTLEQEKQSHACNKMRNTAFDTCRWERYWSPVDLLPILVQFRCWNAFACARSISRATEKPSACGYVPSFFEELFFPPFPKHRYANERNGFSDRQFPNRKHQTGIEPFSVRCDRTGCKLVAMPALLEQIERVACISVCEMEQRECAIERALCSRRITIVRLRSSQIYRPLAVSSVSGGAT